MEGQRVRLKLAARQVRYGEGFKKQVVQEYEKGFLNKDQLMHKYNISGHSTVLQWCRRYGKFAYDSPTKNGHPLKDPQKQRIRELEKKLKSAELKLKVYEKLIEVTNRELGGDIVKNIEARLSANWQQKNG